MSNLLPVFLMLVFTGTAMAKSPVTKKEPLGDPYLQEVINWQKKAPSLSKVLKQHGWWAENKFVSLPDLKALTNKKFSDSPAVIVQLQGTLKKPYATSIKEAGNLECKKASALVPGSVFVSNYQKDTETLACWIYRPTKDKKTEHHQYMTFRTVTKGSNQYIAEAVEIVVDVEGPKPHSIARKIASTLGAK